MVLPSIISSPTQRVRYVYLDMSLTCTQYPQDVYTGSLGGLKVAVKKLRVYKGHPIDSKQVNRTSLAPYLNAHLVK